MILEAGRVVFDVAKMCNLTVLAFLTTQSPPRACLNGAKNVKTKMSIRNPNGVGILRFLLEIFS